MNGKTRGGKTAAVIGSGIAGLTVAAYLADDGYAVTVFEQNDDIGGVTGGFEHEGYRWDLGQLLLEGFGPGEQAGVVLDELGLRDAVPMENRDRAYSFPDFTIAPPEEYGGPWWRKDFFADRFPEEEKGLGRYYRYYRRFMGVVTLARRAEAARGIRKAGLTARMFARLLPLLPRAKWNAERMMDHFFSSEKLKAAFLSILADFTVKPSQFPGLGVAAVNPEPAFDRRVPLEIGGGARQPSYVFLRGGCRSLVDALAGRIRSGGGVIRTGTAVESITVENGRASGITVSGGETQPADLVVATGGAKETFFGLVGREALPEKFAAFLDGLALMESIFMVHLAVDFDPSPHQASGVVYYYLTYDIEDGVDKVMNGLYHGGSDGFVVCIPSFYSPGMAPAGCHAVTVYTVAPDTLAEGDWETEKDAWAEKLLDLAEEKIPGLRAHETYREVIAPPGFRKITRTEHHAFGGCAPVLGSKGAPCETPVRNLWFAGAQSESGAGMNNVMGGARRAAMKIRESRG